MTTNKRKRKAEINRIRTAITVEYHALSTVLCDDRITIRAKDHTGEAVLLPEGMTPDQVIIREPELDMAFDLLSNAINCLNREVGRKENS
jgi:hypothetical protein